MTDGILDEALERLRDTGPERHGWLSNHAPMAAEALVRHGHGTDVHRFLDDYAHRLEEAPRGIAPIAPDEWRDPLGDPTRTGDWIAFFDRAVRDRPWTDVLTEWWPRLLPGIAAGATHGVIRVGHAVRALRAQETRPRIAELGRGLAYWAARWQPLAPAGAGPYRRSDPRAALDAVPRVPDQRFGIRNRLAQLADLPGPPRTAADGSAAQGLAEIVEAAVLRHHTRGYGSPVMLVHAATAPAAVLRALPSLPAALHASGLAAGWAAAAAVTAAYSPAEAHPPARPGDPADPATSTDRAARPGDPATSTDRAARPGDPASSMDRAARSGDPHAIKFADAAVEAYRRHADPALLAAADHATTLIAAD
ncbi:questin oxidase family protein [Jidongwangia harbinensis]|uniref:questin oxidase family protein n=1 Tax=Jidongwangia harbinensis TaxID=2878561 RepID=UPI001CD98648|nr:questin oxidase family protein [Jidongwangia harbinensis]MCA2214675.1 questin oxidase family protein [Jidongwangia harbinensis]